MEGLEELVEWLLDELAYNGDTGVSLLELGNFIRRGINCSPNLALKDRVQSVPDESATRELITPVFEALRVHRDFVIRNDGVGNGHLIDQSDLMPLGEPISDATAATESQTTVTTAAPEEFPETSAVVSAHSLPAQDRSDGNGTTSDKNPSTSESQFKDEVANAEAPRSSLERHLRAYATHSRMWRTLTGHEADYTKISIPEWDVLRKIAMTRGEGILQKDVSPATGQTRRGVQQRIVSLLEKGHLEKKVISRNKHLNHLLIFKRPTYTTTIQQTAESSAETPVILPPEESKVPDSDPVVSEPVTKLVTEIAEPENADQVMAETSATPLDNIQHSRDQTPTQPEISVAITAPPKRRGRPPKKRPETPSMVELSVVQSIDGKETTSSVDPAASHISELPATESSTVSDPSIQTLDKSTTDSMILSTPQKDSTKQDVHSTTSVEHLSVIQTTITTPAPEVESSIHPVKTFNNSERSERSSTLRAPRHAVYTSYDEYQRQAGIPGVYFDIQDITRSTDGSVKRRARSKIALFKSKRLQTILSTNSEDARSDHLVNAAAAFGANNTVSSVPFDSTTVKPPYKSLYGSPETTYKSPYEVRASKSQTPLELEPAAYEPSQREPQDTSERMSPRASTPTPVPIDDAVDTPRSARSTTPGTVDLPEPEYVEADVAAAELLQLPAVACRLSASKNGIAGNLCLSVDKKSLTFIPLRLEASLPSTIKIASIAIPPITSPIDSDPMELEITTTEDEKANTSHKFRFLSSESAFEAANEMRAKIVTSMTIMEFQSFVKPRKGMVASVDEKPFKCDLCAGCWKNMEGLKYHLTKASVPCNPNYVPPTDGFIQRKGRKNQNYVHPADEFPRRVRIKQNAKPPSLPASPLKDSPKPIQPQESGDSTKGVEEDQAQVQDQIEETGVVTEIPEADVFDIIGSMVQGYGNAMEEIDQNASPKQGSYFEPRTEQTPDSTIDQPQLTKTRARKQIIMMLLDANNGVFPGDQSLWFAVKNVWTLKYLALSQPEYRQCNSTVSLLEDSGKIRRIRFSFRSEVGQVQTRSVIMKKEIYPTDPLVIDVKEQIKKDFPKYYVPLAFAQPSAAQETLKERSLRQTEEVENDGRITTYTSDVNMQNRLAGTPDEWLSTGTFEDSLTNEADLDFINGPLNIPGSENDDDYVEESRPRRRQRTKRALDAADQFLEGDLSTPKRQRRKAKRPETPEEVSDLDNVNGQSPGSQPISMQELQHHNDHQTYIFENGEGYREKAKYRFKDRMVEPVTFMQNADSSAWNFQPFGHGVRPIFARPSRRAEGNIGYLSRIESGHRPVVMPVTRVYGPAPLGKSKLLQATSTPRRKRRRSPSESSMNSLAPAKRAYKQRSAPTSSPAKSRMDPLQVSIEIEEDDDDDGQTAPIPDFKPRILPRSNGSVVLPSETLWNPRMYPMFYFPTQMYRSELLPAITPYPRLQFLAPNTYLDDDFQKMTLTASKALPNVPPTFDIINTSLSSTESTEPIVLWFCEPIVVRSRDWEKYGNEDKFAAASYTVNGWFPPHSYFFKQSLPQDLDEILSYTRGRNVEHENHPTQERADFFTSVNEVAIWEQGQGRDLLGTGTAAPNYVFINHTTPYLLQPSDLAPAEVKWSEDNAFTPKNLPYEELQSDREVGKAVVPPPKVSARTRKRQRTYNREDSSYGFLDAPPDVFTTRRLTALAHDLEGLQPLMPNDPRTGLEVLRLQDSSRRKRMKKVELPEQVEKRLMVATVVIQTLTGGLDKSIDWVLVSALFPTCTIAFLTKHWPVLLQKHKAHISKLSTDFQRLFLQAYESGEVAPLNYNRLTEYNWAGLVDWAMPRLEADEDDSAIILPATRSEFEQRYSAEDVVTRAWRDEYFAPLPPVHKRMDYATSEQFTIAVHKPTPPVSIDPLLTLAKSWIRACALVPTEHYNAKLVSEKLRPLGNTVVGKAAAILQDTKVLSRSNRNKGRAAPGRAYEISETFKAALKSHLDEEHFSHAVAFKKSLDARFRAGEKVMLEWTANNGTIMVLTNLQAFGRIRTFPRGMGDNRFGLTGGDYQTKRMDKAKLRFELEITPTEDYMYDSDNPIFARQAVPPYRGAMGELPLWMDINGAFVPWTWRKLVCSVLGTIAIRSGVLLEELVRIFKPAMEDWEAKLLMGWLVEVGAVVPLMDNNDGWSLTEWWWVVAGTE